MFHDPLHFFGYIIIIILSCGAFSRLWLEISGHSQYDILRQFHDNNLVISGMERDKAMIH